MKNDIACPLCGTKNYREYLRKPDRRIVRCLTDRLQFVNPQPDAREITGMYDGNYFSSDKKPAETSVGYYDYVSEKPLLLPYFRRKVALLQKMLPGKKVLEVGSSYGFFLEEAKRVHLDILGIDLSRAAVAYAKRQGLPSRAVDLFNAKFRSQLFDGIAAFHLIEHVPDPLAFMREVYRVTQPGGVLLLATPREDGYLKRLLGRHWPSYRHREHLFFFSTGTITLLLKNAGYRDIRVFGDETRWYPVHFLLRGAKYFFKNRLIKTLFGWSEIVFRVTPFSSIQIPFPLDIMIVTAKK